MQRQFVGTEHCSVHIITEYYNTGAGLDLGFEYIFILRNISYLCKSLNV